MDGLESQRRQLGTSELFVSPLCLGGNVFGWTADREQSQAILTRYVEAGGNFIDTADQYSNWVPGHVGGESEQVIGEWLRAQPARREQIVLATKVGHMGALGRAGGLTVESIKRRTEDSLRRLGVDCVDLLYAHHDDPGTPLEETMTAFDDLVRAGKVRHVAASNYTPERLEEALRTSDRLGTTRFVTLQARYNMLERDCFEGPLSAVCAREGLGCVAYWTLAKGFLTGKYRSPENLGEDRGLSSRAERHRVEDYGDERAWEILGAVEKIADRHGTNMGAVVLAWTAAQPQITATIASARTPAQLEDLLEMTAVELSPEDLAELNELSEPPDPTVSS